jgi:integrase/recombinase XerD
MSQKEKEWTFEGSCQSKLLNEYLEFLCNHRGLSKDTIRIRRNDIISFLKSLRLQNDPEAIGKISVKQVHDHIIKTAKLINRPSRKHLVASLRSFLKFAHLKGYVKRDLTEAIPTIGTPKLGGIPRGISWESVEKLLAAPNRETHSGRRTYAVLQLLITYGVRIGQVEKLRLQDINWREGSIYFRPSKCGNPLHFPLYPVVADALLSYIRETRGKVSYPEVFLTVCGKPKPLAESRALSTLMQRCFHQTPSSRSL